MTTTQSRRRMYPPEMIEAGIGRALEREAAILWRGMHRSRRRGASDNGIWHRIAAIQKEQLLFLLSIRREGRERF